MKIAFDGKRALRNFTGLGNYSRLVIESLARQFPEDKLTIFAPEFSLERFAGNSRLQSLFNLQNAEIRPIVSSDLNLVYKGFPSSLRKSLWRTFYIPKALRGIGADLYHGLSNELPLNMDKAGMPSVLTMHDVIYRTMPHCYSPIDRVLYDYKYGHSCRVATRIIAISECTKKDVMRFYGIPEEKIDVVYQGIDANFRRAVTPSEIAEVRARYSLPERYVIQVGSIEERKNALLSVRALQGLPTDVRLLLVGRHTPYVNQLKREAEKLRLTERVQFLHSVPFPDLPPLLHAASAALYTSRYEGFGLPVLEALACGAPVIAATGSCLEEAGGEAAFYVHPDDAESASQILQAILSGSIDTAARRAEGLRHAEKFTNDTVASNTRKVYEKAIREIQESQCTAK